MGRSQPLRLVSLTPAQVQPVDIISEVIDNRLDYSTDGDGTTIVISRFPDSLDNAVDVICDRIANRINSDPGGRLVCIILLANGLKLLDQDPAIKKLKSLHTEFVRLDRTPVDKRLLNEAASIFKRWQVRVGASSYDSSKLWLRNCPSDVANDLHKLHSKIGMRTGELGSAAIALSLSQQERGLMSRAKTDDVQDCIDGFFDRVRCRRAILKFMVDGLRRTKRRGGRPRRSNSRRR